MPIDVTRIPALEYELEQAKGTKGGGQPPNKGRIAAIEEQIKIHRKALEDQGAPKDPEPENASNVSTDYQSHDVKTDAKPAEKPSKRGVVDVDAEDKAKSARGKQAKAETADDTETRETADA
jgi:hypothetical protein